MLIVFLFKEIDFVKNKCKKNYFKIYAEKIFQA